MKDFASRFKTHSARDILHIVVPGYLNGGLVNDHWPCCIEKRPVTRWADLCPWQKQSKNDTWNWAGRSITTPGCDKILVENGKAVGVRLEDGTEERADIVISAADGRATIFNMLDGKYVDEKIKICITMADHSRRCSSSDWA